jgi:hypothetical protein
VGENFGIDEVIAQIAAGQNGNITRRQLRALGLGDVAINYRLRIGRLFRINRGVYSVGRPPTTPLEKAAAAVLACGDHAALSHSSAMSLWGFWKRWDLPFVGQRRRRPATEGDPRPPGNRATETRRRDRARHPSHERCQDAARRGTGHPS